MRWPSNKPFRFVGSQWVGIPIWCPDSLAPPEYGLQDVIALPDGSERSLIWHALHGTAFLAIQIVMGECECCGDLVPVDFTCRAMVNDDEAPQQYFTVSVPDEDVPWLADAASRTFHDGVTVNAVTMELHGEYVSILLNDAQLGLAIAELFDEIAPHIGTPALVSSEPPSARPKTNQAKRRRKKKGRKKWR